VAEKSLFTECTHRGHVIALVLATRGEMIIVADLMKSVTCLFYDAENAELSIYARDFETHWMTAVESISSDSIIGADNYSNIFTFQKDPSSKFLIAGSRYHLGDMVNRFRNGRTALSLRF
jgi:DNA damage-binding protein 1